VLGEGFSGANEIGEPNGEPTTTKGAVVDVAPRGQQAEPGAPYCLARAGDVGHPSVCDVAMLVSAELLHGRRVSMGTVLEVTSGFSGPVR
jgi:hypothetical protein